MGGSGGSSSQVLFSSFCLYISLASMYYRRRRHCRAADCSIIIVFVLSIEPSIIYRIYTGANVI